MKQFVHLKERQSAGEHENVHRENVNDVHINVRNVSTKYRETKQASIETQLNSGTNNKVSDDSALFVNNDEDDLHFYESDDLGHSSPHNQGGYPTFIPNESSIDINQSGARKETNIFQNSWQRFNLPRNSAYYQFHISASDRFCMRILDVLEHSGCHKGVFTEVIKVVKEETNAGFDPSKMLCISRQAFVNKMKKRFPSPTPINHKVVLEHTTMNTSEVTNVVTFDFKEQLDNLISDLDLFGNLNNLQINPNSKNPWGEMAIDPRYSKLDDVHTGNWYKRTYKELIQDPNTEMLFPIILYIDKTGTDRMNRYGVEPLIFTTTVLNRSTRNRSRAWRTLGFIPGIDQKSTAQKETERNTNSTYGRSIRNYHACLKKILQSLSDMQRTPYTTFVRLGNNIKKVKLHLPVAFVMGDAKSQDNLVTRLGGYQSGFVSRACLCPFVDLDDPYHTCQFMKPGPTDHLVDTILDDRYQRSIRGGAESTRIKAAKEALHGFSRHICRSALRSLNFGVQPFGYIGATPTDLMHAFLEGVLKYAIQSFTSKLNVRGKYDIDNMVDDMFGKLKNSMKKEFPRINFCHGVTNLSFVTAEEWVGLGLCYLLVCLSHRGQCLLQQVHTNDLTRYNKEVARQKTLPRNHPEKNSDINLPILSPDDFLEVLEAMMCFHAWYKVGFPYNMDNYSKKQYNASICKMLDLVKTRLPRQKGNGWKLQKFHEIKHCVRDMMEFGCPANYDTGPCENALIHFAKKPSKTAQKRGHDTFVRQLASNLSEREAILKAQRSMGLNTYMLGNQKELQGSSFGISRHVKRNISEREDVSKTTTDNNTVAMQDNVIDCSQDSLVEEVVSFFPLQPQFQLVFENETKSLLSQKWLGKTKTDSTVLSLDPMVIRHLSDYVKSLSQNDPSERDDTSTDEADEANEIVLNCYTEYIRDNHRFRAHPNYRGEGCWNDWVLVRYDTENNDLFESNFNNDTDYRPYVDHGLYPSKISCFFSVVGRKEKLALICPCLDSDHKGDSVITETWVLDHEIIEDYSYPKSDIVSVDCFEKPIFVVEEYPNWHQSDKGLPKETPPVVMLVKPRDEWAKSFTVHANGL